MPLTLPMLDQNSETSEDFVLVDQFIASIKNSQRMDQRSSQDTIDTALNSLLE